MSLFSIVGVFLCSRPRRVWINRSVWLLVNLLGQEANKAGFSSCLWAGPASGQGRPSQKVGLHSKGMSMAGLVWGFRDKVSQEVSIPLIWICPSPGKVSHHHKAALEKRVIVGISACVNTALSFEIPHPAELNFLNEALL